MTSDIVSVSPQTDVADVVQLMDKHRIKRVPVINNGHLTGIISRANLVRALIKHLVKKPAHSVSDEETRKAILNAIAVEPWAPCFGIDVEVEDRVVDIYGTITDERKRIALRALVENVPGVKGVRDHLVWVEPVSGMVIPAEGE